MDAKLCERCGAVMEVAAAVVVLIEKVPNGVPNVKVEETSERELCEACKAQVKADLKMK